MRLRGLFLHLRKIVPIFTSVIYRVMKSLFNKVKCIAFDADDTLWVNEPYFRKAEEEYCAVLERFAGRKEIIDTLYGIEMKNLAPYGYGAKAFTLSLMETAILFSNRRASGENLSHTFQSNLHSEPQGQYGSKATGDVLPDSISSNLHSEPQAQYGSKAAGDVLPDSIPSNLHSEPQGQYGNVSSGEGVAPLTPSEMGRIIQIGTSLINIPMEILPGVEDVLKELWGSGKYTLVVATKGDLLDQQRKLDRSGLAKYFHHIEVMSNKDEAAFGRLLGHLGCRSEEFLMIGNSMKSDILPVLNIGGNAIYIPFHSTWEHEKVEGDVQHPNLYECSSCAELRTSVQFQSL